MAITYKTVIANAIANFNDIQTSLGTLGAKYTSGDSLIKIPVVTSSSALVPTNQFSDIIKEQLQLKASGNINLTTNSSTDVSKYATATVRSASGFSLSGTAKDSTNVSIGTLASGYYPVSANVSATLNASTAGWFTSGSASQTYVVGRIQAGAITLSSGSDQNLTSSATFSKITTDDSTLTTINVGSDSSVGAISADEKSITSDYPYFIAVSSTGSTQGSMAGNAKVTTAGYIPSDYSFSASSGVIKGTVSGNAYIPVKRASINQISISGTKSLSIDVGAETSPIVSEDDSKNITAAIFGDRTHTAPTDDADVEYYIALDVNPTGGASKSTTLSASSSVKSNGFIRTTDSISGSSATVSASTKLSGHSDYYPIKKAKFRYVQDSASGANFIECLTSGYIASGAITNFDSSTTPDYAIIKSTISGTGVNSTSGYKLSLSSVIDPGYISQSNGSITLDKDFYISKTSPSSTYFTETSGSTAGTGIAASAMAPGYINGLSDSGKTIYIKSGSISLSGGSITSTVSSISGTNATLSDSNDNGLGISIAANSSASGTAVSVSGTTGWIAPSGSKSLTLGSAGSKTRYLTKLTIPYVSGKSFGSYVSSSNYSNGIELAGTAYTQMSANTADLRLREFGETTSTPIQVVSAGKLVAGTIGQSGTATGSVTIDTPTVSNGSVTTSDTGILISASGNSNATTANYIVSKAGWVKANTSGTLNIGASGTSTKTTYLNSIVVAADKTFNAVTINAKGDGTNAGAITTLTNNGSIGTLNGTGTIGVLSGTQTVGTLSGTLNATIDTTSGTKATLKATIGSSSYTFVENGAVKNHVGSASVSNSGMTTYFTKLSSNSGANVTLTGNYNVTTGGFIGTGNKTGGTEYYSIKTTSISSLVSTASVSSVSTSPTANKGAAKTTTSSNANYVTISVSSGATSTINSAGWISSGTKNQTSAGTATAYIDAAVTPTLTGPTVNQTKDFSSLDTSVAQSASEPTSNKTSTSGVMTNNKDKYIISGEKTTSVVGPETTGSCVDWYVEALYRRMNGASYTEVSADE